MKGPADRLLRAMRTARYLRAEQWFFWPWRRVQRALSANPRPVHGHLDGERLTQWQRLWREMPPDGAGSWRAAADRVLDGRFGWLGIEHELGERPPWRNPRVESALWTYHLHYFDFAVDLARAAADTGDDRYLRRLEFLIVDWLDATADGGGPGWEPYPTSLRVLSWARVLGIAGERLQPAVRERLGHALATSVAWLWRRRELHLQGNHLLANGCALWIGSWLLSGSAARASEARAQRWLTELVVDQILPDGGHVERSPMYHAHILADLIELLQAARMGGAPFPTAFESRADAMASWLRWFVRSDGSLHLFQDAGNDPALDPRILLERVSADKSAVANGAFVLPESRYGGWKREEGPAIVIDGGEPAPAYQPGHAHASAFSFELDWDGHPIVVDSGTRGYDGDPWREYVRSTRAHNTVMLDGQEQSELWGTFRVARRVDIERACWTAHDDGIEFEGRCRGFSPRAAVHERVLRLRNEMIDVRDRVDGNRPARLESFVHFHPACQVVQEGGRWIVVSPRGRLMLESTGFRTVSLVSGTDHPKQGWYCPAFGVAIPAPTLVLCDPAADYTWRGFQLTRWDR